MIKKKYLRIKERIKREIINGKLKQGDKIISVSQMIKKFKVSHMTAYQAIKELENEGVVISKQGDGTYVAKSKEELEVLKGESQKYFSEYNFFLPHKKTKLIYSNFETSKVQKEAYSKIINNFCQKYSRIKIEQVNIDYEQIFSGKVSVDCFQMLSRDIPTVASRDIAYDITQFVNVDNSLDLKEYFSQSIEKCKYNGRYYGLPITEIVDVLYYNKNCFDNLSILYLNEEIKWEDYSRISKEISENSNNKIIGSLIYFGPLSYFRLFDSDALDISKKRANYKSQKIEKALRVFLSLTKEERGSLEPNYLPNRNYVELFSEGKLAMWMTNTAYLTVFNNTPDLNYGVIRIPRLDTGTNIHVGVVNCISVNTSCLWETWEFIKYLSSEDALQIFAEIKNNIPAIKRLAESSLFLNFNQQKLDFLLTELKNAQFEDYPYPISKDISNILYNLLHGLLKNELTIKETMDEMTLKCNQYLNTLSFDSKNKVMSYVQ